MSDGMEPGGRPEWLTTSYEPNPTFTVKKIGYSVPVSCCLSDVGECNHPPLPELSRRQRLGWWLARQWDNRPRVHFGPCDHEDCW